MKVELGKGGQQLPGLPEPFSLSSSSSSSKGHAIGSIHGREEGDHGGPTLACKDFSRSLSHGVCFFHKSLPSLSSFPQLLLLSMLTLATHSLGCVLREVRVTAGAHPAHEPACHACRPRSHRIGAGCRVLLRNHLLTHPSLARLSEIMPAFKNHIAALHDIFIHFFRCHELLQISSCEASGKDSGVFFALGPLKKAEHLFLLCLSGTNLNLLIHRGHSWKCWELPSPKLVQDGPKAGSSLFLIVSISHMLSLVCCVSTAVRPIRAAD